jgi:hypothetical protein
MNLPRQAVKSLKSRPIPPVEDIPAPESEDLLRIVAAWPTLSKATRERMLALVDGAKPLARRAGRPQPPAGRRDDQEVDT